MRQIKAAAIQMKCDLEHKKNLQKAEQMIRKAAAEGANIILLPELFESTSCKRIGRGASNQLL